MGFTFTRENNIYSGSLLKSVQLWSYQGLKFNPFGGIVECKIKQEIGSSRHVYFLNRGVYNCEHAYLR